MNDMAVEARPSGNLEVHLLDDRSVVSKKVDSIAQRQIQRFINTKESSVKVDIGNLLGVQKKKPK